jgi:hypothetical protein
MGKTAFSGPVYGAKSLLWSYGPYGQIGSSGASTVLYRENSVRPIPAYEDWYITEVHVATSTNSSVAGTHGIKLKSEGGSTTGIVRQDLPSTVTQTIVAMVNPSGGSTTWNAIATVTASAGEYEGLYVPAGSTLRLVSSGVAPLGNTQINVMGYIRYVNSTRAS